MYDVYYRNLSIFDLYCFVNISLAHRDGNGKFCVALFLYSVACTMVMIIMQLPVHMVFLFILFGQTSHCVDECTKTLLLSFLKSVLYVNYSADCWGREHGL